MTSCSKCNHGLVMVLDVGTGIDYLWCPGCNTAKEAAQ